MIRPVAVIVALALQCGILIAPPALGAAAITYVDMSSDGRTTLSAPGEEVRLFINGGGCRVPRLDSGPEITGDVIEFALVFSASCFATPPGYHWQSDLDGVPVGTYVIKHYMQFTSDGVSVSGPKTLFNSGILIVAPRPIASASTQPGILDPSFGDGGIADIPFPGFFAPPLRIAKQQQNGGMVVGSPSSPTYSVSRLLDSGAVDAAFAETGTITYADSTARMQVFALAGNDEILLAGQRYDIPGDQMLFAVQRYSPSGIFESQIDISPKALGGTAGAYPNALDIATLADGRFVVTGTFGSYCTGGWFVARLTASGALDPSFGVGGVYVGPTPGCVYRLVPTNDGGLLGMGATSDPINADFLTKLDTSGRLDRGFGTGGTITGAFARMAPRLQEDGKILLGNANFSLQRLNSNGSLDTSFGNSGVLPNQTGIAMRLEDFVLMPDKSLLLGGATVVATGRPGDPNVLTLQPIVTHYNADGSLDRAFGQAGLMKITGLISSSSLGGWGPAEAMALLPLPNGKALLSTPNASDGWWNRATTVYRFQVTPSAPANYQGLWWVPDGAESGWGLNIAHQGDTIVATWFTYGDAYGLDNSRGLWLVMTAPKIAPNTYAGDLYFTRGPPFNAIPFDPTKVGIYHPSWPGQLQFSDANNGTFSFSVPDGFGAPPYTRMVAIARETFGPLPICTFGAQPNLALATNYTDLWWAAPAASEAGWGINLTHQGDTIFATWFTYDLDGSSMWLVATTQRTSSGTYIGTLYRTTGPAYFTQPFDPTKVVAAPVGSITLTFADGNAASFAYTVGATTQTKEITREVFVAPGTVCQ